MKNRRIYYCSNYSDPDRSKWPAKDCGKYIRIRKYPVEVEVFRNYFPRLRKIFKVKDFYMNEAAKR
jgi:hypothetical protein